jgi:hypothetical protein
MYFSRHNLLAVSITPISDKNSLKPWLSNSLR